MKKTSKKKNKYTLNQLGSKIDQIGDALMEHIKDFKVLKQEVKNINARLDYNGLKKLPTSK